MSDPGETFDEAHARYEIESCRQEIARLREENRRLREQVASQPAHHSTGRPS